MKVDVFCIGTPNIHGDALGPLVGSMLSISMLDVNIVGTVDDPVVRSNYEQQLMKLRADATIIVVDAVIGAREKVGTYTIEEGSILPGEAMNTGIPPIGHIAIKCTTGTTVFEMSLVDPWMICMLAYNITTELMDMLQSNKIKEIYR